MALKKPMEKPALWLLIVILIVSTAFGHDNFKAKTHEKGLTRRSVVGDERQVVLEESGITIIGNSNVNVDGKHDAIDDENVTAALIEEDFHITSNKETTTEINIRSNPPNFKLETVAFFTENYIATDILSEELSDISYASIPKIHRKRNAKPEIISSLSTHNELIEKKYFLSDAVTSTMKPYGIDIIQDQNEKEHSLTTPSFQQSTIGKVLADSLSRSSNLDELFNTNITIDYNSSTTNIFNFDNDTEMNLGLSDGNIDNSHPYTLIEFSVSSGGVDNKSVAASSAFSLKLNKDIPLEVIKLLAEKVMLSVSAKFESISNETNNGIHANSSSVGKTENVDESLGTDMLQLPPPCKSRTCLRKCCLKHQKWSFYHNFTCVDREFLDPVWERPLFRHKSGEVADPLSAIEMAYGGLNCRHHGPIDASERHYTLPNGNLYNTETDVEYGYDSYCMEIVQHDESKS